MGVGVGVVRLDLLDDDFDEFEDFDEFDDFDELILDEHAFDDAEFVRVVARVRRCRLVVRVPTWLVSWRSWLTVVRTLVVRARDVGLVVVVRLGVGAVREVIGVALVDVPGPRLVV